MHKTFPVWLSSIRSTKVWWNPTEFLGSTISLSRYSRALKRPIGGWEVSNLLAAQQTHATAWAQATLVTSECLGSSSKISMWNWAPQTASKEEDPPVLCFFYVVSSSVVVWHKMTRVDKAATPQDAMLLWQFPPTPVWLSSLISEHIASQHSSQATFYLQQAIVGWDVELMTAQKFQCLGLLSFQMWY